MAQDPNCTTCRDLEIFKEKLSDAFSAAKYPFTEILSGLMSLLQTETSKHGERHLIRCVTGEDGND
jgi:hypothetical protein